MERNLSSKLFNESFLSLIFKQGLRVSLYVRVLSFVIDGVDQAVTGGRLRHSRGEKKQYSTPNNINESISFDLAFSYCLNWLRCLAEIIGNCFVYNLVIGFSADQTPVTPSLPCGWGCNVRFCNPSATVVILGGVV